MQAECSHALSADVGTVENVLFDHRGIVIVGIAGAAWMKYDPDMVNKKPSDDDDID